MILILSLFFSFVLTLIVKHIALKKNIIDNPNERSSHTVPTPRGGGLAIVVVWFFGLAYLHWGGRVEQGLFYALLSGLVLAVVSMIDDVISLTPKIRVLAQAISAFGALYFLGGIHLFVNFDSQVLFLLTNVCAFIGIIWFINLYNFLDGIDAYASQEAILVAAGLLIITGNPIIGILIAAVVGFLVWNWPKAKIFMGDVGSTQLGFILIVLGIYFHNTGELPIFSWLILTSLFWFDATFTLFNRWRNREQLSKAHRKHGYQRLTIAGWTHLKVVLYAIALNMLLVAIVLANHFYFQQNLIALIITIVMLFFVNRRVNKIYPFPKD